VNVEVCETSTKPRYVLDTKLSREGDYGLRGCMKTEDGQVALFASQRASMALFCFQATTTSARQVSQRTPAHLQSALGGSGPDATARPQEVDVILLAKGTVNEILELPAR
jgi:hypothetical protein